MKRLALLLCVSMLAPAQAEAKSERSLILGFLRAVDKGHDLTTVYPGAISKSHAEKLLRFADCEPDNPISLKKGEFWVIFVCSRTDMIGAQINISEGKIFNIWTHPAVATWSKPTPFGQRNTAASRKTPSTVDDPPKD